MTPKAKSAEFKELRARLQSLFDPASLLVVGVGAFERQRAEALASRLTGARRAALHGVSREELATSATDGGRGSSAP